MIYVSQLEHIRDTKINTSHTQLIITTDQLSINTIHTISDPNDTEYTTLIAGEEISPEFSGKFVQIDSFIITLEQFRKRAEFAAATCWTPSFDMNKCIGLYNVTARTLAERLDIGIYPMYIQQNLGLLIFVPFLTSDFTQMKYRATLTYTDEILISNKEIIKVSIGEKIRSKEFFPSLNIIGPDIINADSSEIYNIKSFLPDNTPTDKKLEIYLEHYNGYLPKTQFNMTGETSFKVFSTGLMPGDTIKIKAGFRYWVGAAIKTITVI